MDNLLGRFKYHRHAEAAKHLTPSNQDNMSELDLVSKTVRQQKLELDFWLRDNEQKCPPNKKASER